MFRRLGAGVVPEVGWIHGAEHSDIGAQGDGLAIGKIERRVAIEKSVEGEQRLGAGGVQLGEVEQRRAPQCPGDVAILPPALGAALAVAVEPGRPDEGHVADLAGERDPEVGEPEPGGELLDVVVLAGAHVASDREMEREKARRVGAPHCLDLGEAVQHPEIDVVGVGGGDLADALIVVGHVVGNCEPFEDDGFSRPYGILECHRF